MIIIRRAPHGTIYVHEAIEVMLIVAAFEMELSIVFMDDGVLALKKGQDTKELGTKGFMATFGALADWEITNVYADSDSLKERGVQESELVSIGEDEETEEPLFPKSLSPDQIRSMMDEQHSIVNF